MPGLESAGKCQMWRVLNSSGSGEEKREMLTIAELMPRLRAIYGDFTPSAAVLRAALCEGRVVGRRSGREWLVDPDLEAVALALRLPQKSGQTKAA